MNAPFTSSETRSTLFNMKRAWIGDQTAAGKKHTMYCRPMWIWGCKDVPADNLSVTLTYFHESECKRRDTGIGQTVRPLKINVELIES